MIKHGLITHGLIKHGLIKHGLIKHGLIKHGVIKHDRIIKHGLMKHGVIKHAFLKAAEKFEGFAWEKQLLPPSPVKSLWILKFDSFENFEIYKDWYEKPCKLDWVAKVVFLYHTNASNFERPLQSLLLPPWALIKFLDL